MSASVLVAAALAVVWCATVGDFGRGQVVLGLILGSAYVLATGTGRGRRVPLAEIPRRLVYLLLFLLVLLPYEVVRSNLSMARRLLRRTPALRPGILRVPLGEEVSRATVALEEHAITLTPGQMVVDYSADENTAYVHFIDVHEAESLRRSTWKRYRTVLDRIFT
jgi:multisubunit Na+/H+ antiporter MnhE subunit